MILKDILKKKGNRVVHVFPGTTISDAVKTMVSNKIGAVLVTDEAHKPRGIFTERDLLKLIADGNFDFNMELVDNHMTKEVVIGEPSDSVEEAMALMTEQRVRHLPVVSDDLLVGLVSIGDVVKELASSYDRELRYLKDYIHGT